MWNFKPCKKVNVFKYDENNVYIAASKGIVHLNKAGKILWMMANGKHTVSDIVDNLCSVYNTDDKQKVYDNLVKLMMGLEAKNLLVLNWDPLYKYTLSQRGECV